MCLSTKRRQVLLKKWPNFAEQPARAHLVPLGLIILWLQVRILLGPPLTGISYGTGATSARRDLL